VHLGIDLGTTNSAVAGSIGTDIRIFKTLDGTDVLPSILYIDKGGHRLYGQRAFQQAMVSPENVAAGFKRLMGTSAPIEFAEAGQTLTAEACSAEILKHLVGQAFVESGESEVAGTVVTIPAAFNQMQSEATLRAATKAGLDKVALLQEPIAAAMTSMAHSQARNGLFLVYDLGGGTFDLALVHGRIGTVSVVAHEGVNMLGGRDFDRAIVNDVVRPWLIETFDLPVDFLKDRQYRRLARIGQIAAEKAKMALSLRTSEKIFATDEEVRIKDRSGRDVYLEIDLERPMLERLVREKLDETVVLSRKILADNNCKPEDIDRIVFIGGATKMHSVRDYVPRELGITADVKTDAMTAVALGAAMFAESREWRRDGTRAKSARAYRTAGGALQIKLDFPSRTADDRAVIHVYGGRDAVDKQAEIQISAPSGWHSKRERITGDLAIEVPLASMGRNAFRAVFYDGTGKPVVNGSTEVAIVRTYAAAAGVPATQTLAVKVLDAAGGERNRLQPLIGKGTLLPASGRKTFQAAHELAPGSPAHLDVEIFQQDAGVDDPEISLPVGVFRLRGADLSTDAAIGRGDPIVFHWSMNDSGLLSATVELPLAGRHFSAPNFYVDQAGHASFAGEEGERMAAHALDRAEREMTEFEEATGGSAGEAGEALRRRLATQRTALGNAGDADALRAVTEEARHMRQTVARLAGLPEHRAKVLRYGLAEVRTIFDQIARETADKRLARHFDSLLKEAQKRLKQDPPKSIEAVEQLVSEMEAVMLRSLWSDPGFVVYLFQDLRGERYLASDKARFDRLVAEGGKALDELAMEELRRITEEICRNQYAFGANRVAGKLASVSPGDTGKPRPTLPKVPSSHANRPAVGAR